MTIIQITDLHLPGIGEKVDFTDTQRNFLAVIDQIKKTEHVDMLVISGDLCYANPTQSVYDYVFSVLEETGYNFRIISGNHDSSIMYSQKIIGKAVAEMYYESDQVLFLDTAPGTMSDQQWLWLENILYDWQNDHVTIFMHHPPILASMPHLDNNYPFKEIDRFKELLSKFSKIRFDVFTGHYHVERSIVYRNCHLFITPSCFVQIADDTAEFKIDHTIPAYRRIKYDDEGNLTTTLRYLFPK